PYEFPRTRPEMTAQDQRHLEEFAERLENLKATRERESRAVAVPSNFNPPRAFAYQHAEAVPGASLDISPQLLAASEGSRATWSGRVTKAQRDVQDHDIINKALGLNTIETRPTQGVYQSPGHPVEFQSGYATGAEVPVSYTKSGKPSLDKLDEQRLRTAAAI